ncbi:MAG: glycosyltransferase [Cyclobacteriaceae bacterium]
MKIAHVVESFGAGTAKFIESLVNGLDDHQHFIIYGPRSPNLQNLIGRFPPGVDFISWPSVQRAPSILQDSKALYQLLRLLKKGEYDIVHLHSSKAGFLGRVAAFLIGKKETIFTPNGASFVRKDISWLKKVFFISLEKLAASLSGKVICCSESECEGFNKYGIKADYINNGVEISNSKHTYDYSSDLIVVTSGRVSNQKNPAQFNAIAKHFIEDKSMKFVWVGDGELKGLLDSENVHLTGWLEPDEAKKVVRSSHIYISTALWEGLPFAVLEAMNGGMPLILNNCVGNIDLVSEGKNGFLFNSSEQAVSYLSQFRQNPDNMRKMGMSSQHICANEFSVDIMLQKYNRSYIQLANT